MALVIANQHENHRSVYWEVTGDGATTAFTITHHRMQKTGHTVAVFGVTAPTKQSGRSGRGGLLFPEDGTAVALASSSLSGSTISVTTSAAIANATVAYFVAVFDQTTD